MSSDFKGRFLGILGGMGPMAGAFFLARLIALTEVEREQDHIPAILWNDPRVPDRPAAWWCGGADPFPWLKNGIRHLERCGANAIVIPCNTAHLWYDRVAASSRVPVLHIVEAVIDDLRRHGIGRARVGLLGTAVTLKSGLYQASLEAAGYECIVPSDEEIDRYCTRSILLVKANRLAESFGPAADCVRLLQHRGADAVILGCTELPLAIPHALRADFGIKITDSIDALARAALAWYFTGRIQIRRRSGIRTNQTI